MAKYSTYGHLFGKMPYTPIIKVKNWDIKIPQNIYTPGANGSGASDETAEQRKQLLNELAPWYKLYNYTWTRLQAADSKMVSNNDLAFLLDLAWNLAKYYPDDKILYSTIDARTAFRFEVTEFIIQGYEPVDAQKKALESIKAEKFISKEPLLVKVTSMSTEEKKKANEAGSSGGGNILPGQGTDDSTDKKEAQEKRNRIWLIAGIAILILTAK